MDDPRHDQRPSSDLPELVAVLELNDDANEDRWAMASGGAERVVLEAAEAAGYDPAALTLTWLDSVTRCAAAPDGRRFAATIRAAATAPHLWRARPPSEEELLAWPRQQAGR